MGKARGVEVYRYFYFNVVYSGFVVLVWLVLGCKMSYDVRYVFRVIVGYEERALYFVGSRC